MDEEGLLTLIRLLRLGQPLGKGQLQRLMHNLCANTQTREARTGWLARRPAAAQLPASARACNLPAQCVRA